MAQSLHLRTYLAGLGTDTEEYLYQTACKRCDLDPCGDETTNREVIGSVSSGPEHAEPCYCNMHLRELTSKHLPQWYVFDKQFIPSMLEEFARGEYKCQGDYKFPLSLLHTHPAIVQHYVEELRQKCYSPLPAPIRYAKGDRHSYCMEISRGDIWKPAAAHYPASFAHADEIILQAFDTHTEELLASETDLERNIRGTAQIDDHLSLDRSQLRVDKEAREFTSPPFGRKHY